MGKEKKKELYISLAHSAGPGGSDHGNSGSVAGPRASDEVYVSRACARGVAGLKHIIYIGPPCCALARSSVSRCGDGPVGPCNKRMIGSPVLLKHSARERFEYFN